MKSSVHLFYGIIIGILATHCVAQTTSESVTATSSRSDQLKFSQGIYRVKWDNGIFYAVPETSKSRTSYVRSALVKSSRGNLGDLRRSGWTIIDFEMDNGSPSYLIGK